MARAGYTNYDEAILHRYDVPVRLATVGRIIRRLFPAGLAWRSVLDIGCGTGDCIVLLVELGAPSVRGVGISPKVFAKAASGKAVTSAPSAELAQPEALRLARRIRRKVLAIIRVITLMVCYLTEHWLHLPLPLAATEPPKCLCWEGRWQDAVE